VHFFASFGNRFWKYLCLIVSNGLLPFLFQKIFFYRLMLFIEVFSVDDLKAGNYIVGSVADPVFKVL